MASKNPERGKRLKMGGADSRCHHEEARRALVTRLHQRYPPKPRGTKAAGQGTREVREEASKLTAVRVSRLTVSVL